MAIVSIDGVKWPPEYAPPIWPMPMDRVEDVKKCPWFLAEFVSYGNILHRVTAHYGSSKVVEAILERLSFPISHAPGIFHDSRFDPRISQAYDYWIPNDVAQIDASNFKRLYYQVQRLRYLVAGGDRYSDIRAYLLRTYPDVECVQEILGGRESARIIYSLWVLTQLGVPKWVYRAYIFPRLIMKK